jgi:DNA-binding response OmpR family regulator
MELAHKESAVYRAAPHSIKVLLVEDDPEDAVLTRVQLSEGSDSPFQIEWKEDFQTAMARLQEPGIDVVLLDLGMKELQGYRTHLAIKRVSAAPVVILTSDESANSQDLTKTARLIT